jgi:hypothetical protein
MANFVARNWYSRAIVTVYKLLLGDCGQINLPGWHNWLARKTLNLKALGSNPRSGFIEFFFRGFSHLIMPSAQVWTSL